jgi:hypothetical protein
VRWSSGPGAPLAPIVELVPRARGGIMSELLLDRAGRRDRRRRCPGFRAGHAPGNKGLRYPADPLKVEEIIAVMRRRWRRTARSSPTRAHRAAVASRPAHPRGASPSQKATSINAAARSRSGAARAGAVARSAWTRERGTNSSPGLTYGAGSRSVRFCASSTARRADGTGRPPRPVPSCAIRRPRQEFGVASRHMGIDDALRGRRGVGFDGAKRVVDPLRHAL